MKKYLKFLIPVAIILGGFVMMQVLASFKTDLPVRQPKPVTRFLQSQVVQLGDVPATISAFGRIASAQPVALFSEVAGMLQKGDIPFLPSQSFRRGQLIVKIDDRQIRLEVNSAKSDLLNALAQVLPEIKIDFPDEFPAWQKYFEGVKFGTPIAPLPEAGNSRIKLFLARFNIYRLYFNIQNLEIRQQKHYFYAPFSGAITITALRTGATARAGTQLGDIISMQDMEVEVPFATNDLRWIDKSRTVRFTSSEIPGEWEGRIKRIGKTIDTQTQTIPVYVSLDGNAAEQIFDGIFLNAFIPGNTVASAFIVPNNAIYEEKFVYLIESGRLKYQPVGVARRETGHVIVNSGLQSGDTLVVELLQGVAPGMLAKARLLSLTERGGK